ncbi:MAG: response regulator [Elusimicrobia bacterium]|nr:response regulator [Elusimicrobiota bacterium]
MENLKGISNQKQDQEQEQSVIEEEKKVPSILIIEDEEVERYTLKTALEAEGFFVEAAEKGAEAESIAKTIAFDIIIVDYRLPDMDGVTVTKRLQALSSEFTPIFVTGHTSLEIALEAMRIGAYDYISKPLDIAKLVKIIYKILEEKRILARSRRALNTLIEKGEVEMGNDDKLMVISSPDENVEKDNTKIDMFKTFKGILSAIKNYYWGI